MLKYITTALIAFSLLLSDLGAIIQVRIGHRAGHPDNRHRNQYWWSNHHYRNRNYEPYHHNQHGPREGYYFVNLGRSRIIDTYYSRSSRVVELRNGMRFRIPGHGYDWTGQRVRIYKRVIRSGWGISFANENLMFGYRDQNYGHGGYRLVIGGYEYRAHRLD